MLANHGERGKRKLADKWDSTPSDVVSVRSGINMYRIRDVITGRERELCIGTFSSKLTFLTVDECPASLVDSDNLDVSVELNDVSVAHSPDPVPVSVAHSPNPAPISVEHSSDPVSARVAHLSMPDVSHLTLIVDVDENTAKQKTKG